MYTLETPHTIKNQQWKKNTDDARGDAKDGDAQMSDDNSDDDAPPASAAQVADLSDDDDDIFAARTGSSAATRTVDSSTHELETGAEGGSGGRGKQNGDESENQDFELHHEEEGAKKRKRLMPNDSDSE